VLLPLSKDSDLFIQITKPSHFCKGYELTNIERVKDNNLF
jgi:hypothetical protein